MIWTLEMEIIQMIFSVNHMYYNPGVYNVKLTSKMDSIGTCVDEYEKLIYIIDLYNIIEKFFRLLMFIKK